MEQESQAAGPETGASHDVEVLVVGAGLSGICTAVMLKNDGVDNFVIIDKEVDFGGTWLVNTYPGVACDIPSPLYSFGFAPNPGWSRLFAPGDEIQRYLLDIVHRHRLRDHARFETELLDALWSADAGRWIVTTTGGTYRARIMVTGTGSLHAPKRPDIPGIEEFQGDVFHSSQWPADFDPTGRRIAVVGTGASSIQIVPRLQRSAEHVTVLQRTPTWIYPKPDRVFSRVERFAFRRVPLLGRILRLTTFAFSEVVFFALLHPRWAPLLALPARLNLLRVKNKKLRQALTPDYTIGCKRFVISNEFYPTLTKPNVSLVTSPLSEVRPNSVITADGTEVAVDTIVLSTGFHFTDSPIYQRIRDKDGVDLTTRWKGSPQAYLGTTVSGCPNLFVLWGPNSGGAPGFTIAEAQVRYVRAAMRTMSARHIGQIEVREDIEDRWKAHADRITKRSVFDTGGCTSYYLDANGRNATLWPGSIRSMWSTLGTFNLEDYDHQPTKHRSVFNETRVTT
jgi:cation diffusion facilitator CzcD-associated flavoprotein CzcO